MATHQNLDADLIAMTNRLDKIYDEWDRAGEDDPRIDAFCDEAGELERTILATPAFTEEGLAGKRRIVERAELSAWDDLEIIDVIFRLDAERIAAR